MTHAAPGSGSPADNPNFTPTDQPYEPQQGTGEAEKPQEEVDAEQERDLPFIAPSDAAPHTDVDGRAIPPEPEKPRKPGGRHARKSKD